MCDCYELGGSISKKNEIFYFFERAPWRLFVSDFIEGGALSSNTVLIAFEGFNLFSIFLFTNL